MMSLPVNLATDVLAISKIFCCPDYDIYSSMTKQEASHEGFHKLGVEGMKDMIKDTEHFRGQDRFRG
jgi:hypothetical protein